MAPFPADPEPAPARTDGLERLGLHLLVLVFAGMGVALAAVGGRLDSVLLVVGVPSALAIAVSWIDSSDSEALATFQVTTVVLLMSCALLHAAAVLLLCAAPFLYLAVFAAYGLASCGRTA